MQPWFFRLPSPARALITAACSAAAIFGVMSLYAVYEPWTGTGKSVLARLVVSILGGLLTGVIAVVVGDRRIRRVYGSPEQAITYFSAMRTGRLPSRIEPTVWRRWLDVSRKSVRAAPASVVVFVLLSVLQGVDHQWVLASVLGLAAAWQGAVGWQLHRRVSRLASAVGEQAAATG
jgi:hypothetical protein